MCDNIPLSIPNIQGNEWKYTKDCLDSGWVSTAGKYVNLFERKIEEYTGSKHAIACVNGTSALHISLILAGVKPDDEIIVPSLTFIAPVNAIKYCNAYPIFMDSNEFYTIHIEKTIEFIINHTKMMNGYSFNKSTNRRVSAIIPVHVFGNAIWFDQLYKVCKERNIRIIEDSTESLGTRYCKGEFNERFTGTVGDLGCISFNGNKIITCGGGGMILTNNTMYAEKAKYLTTQAKNDSIYYVHDEVGYNYRLTNLQAAIGVAQLEKINHFIETKKNNYNYYNQGIEKIHGLHLANVPTFAESNYWMYALVIDKGNFGYNRDELLELLRKESIETRPIWKLNHLQKPYLNCQSYKIEMATKLVDNTLNIPSSSTLGQTEINCVVETLKKSVKE